MKDGMCKGCEEIAFQVEAIGHRLVGPWSSVGRSMVISIISIHFESRLFWMFSCTVREKEVINSASDILVSESQCPGQNAME